MVGQITDLASKQAGGDVEIFATHEDHAFGTIDGRVIKVTFSDSDGESVRIEDADIPIITEANQDEFVASEIRRLAREMMGEDCANLGNRLLAVSRNLQPETSYWASDGFSVGEELLGQGLAWLEDSGGYDAIRGGVEHVEKTERSVPSVPYARIPKDRLEAFRPELMDSMRVIGDRLDSLVEVMGGFASDARATRVAGEAARLRGAIDAILKFSDPDDLPRIAEFHDNLAEWTRPMLVLGAFLVSESKAENEDNAD